MTGAAPGQPELFGLEIWTVAGPRVRFYAIPFETRMTVVRLGSGGLWVHSPVSRDCVDEATLAELGPVTDIVAPNKIHSLWIEPWARRWPKARIWLSPRYRERHPDAVGTPLTTDARPDWTDEVAHQPIEGHRILDEVAFLHRASRTLILTDLIQKHDPVRDAWPWRILKRLAGISGRDGGVPWDIRMSFGNRVAAARTIGAILDWEFDNLIVSHGFCVRGEARANVERAFGSLASRTG